MTTQAAARAGTTTTTPARAAAHLVSGPSRAERRKASRARVYLVRCETKWKKCVTLSSRGVFFFFLGVSLRRQGRLVGPEGLYSWGLCIMRELVNTELSSLRVERKKLGRYRRFFESIFRGVALQRILVLVLTYWERQSLRFGPQFQNALYG